MLQNVTDQRSELASRSIAEAYDLEWIGGQKILFDAHPHITTNVLLSKCKQSLLPALLAYANREFQPSLDATFRILRLNPSLWTMDEDGGVEEGGGGEGNLGQEEGEEETVGVNIKGSDVSWSEPLARVCR